uniref:F-box domain-containing protein n=1 Tax=Tetraselmis sp. GSL018 TaxID=582737 RepID=A0A061RRF0_9CHLO
MSGLRFSIPGFLSWSPTDSEQVEKTLSCDTVLKTQTWEDDLNDLSEDEAGASEAPSGLNVPDTQQVETCRPWKRALPSEARSDSRDDAIGIGLLQLPDSVIFRILTYLPCADICQVMQTSHAARELASSEVNHGRHSTSLTLPPFPFRALLLTPSPMSQLQWLPLSPRCMPLFPSFASTSHSPMLHPSPSLPFANPLPSFVRSLSLLVLTLPHPVPPPKCSASLPTHTVPQPRSR